jgi:hypothetical protein
MEPATFCATFDRTATQERNMKRPIYLLSLALAVAAGVGPASAQQVTFQVNPTTNACAPNYNLTLRPPGIYLASGQATTIPNAIVTSIRDNAFVTYYPSNNLLVGVGQGCTFSECNGRKIVLTCLGAGPGQAVQFARGGATRRK